MCSCSSLMRAVKRAICTSGDPVSRGSRRNWSMICVLRSLVIDIGLPRHLRGCCSCQNYCTFSLYTAHHRSNHLNESKGGRKNVPEALFPCRAPGTCEPVRLGG